MLRIGVIGFGYWGPNLARNFSESPECELVAICDQNPVNLKRAQKLYPEAKLFAEWEDLIQSLRIDAVAVATPAVTHYPIGKRALEEGKHLFMEKPIALSSRGAQELIELADQKGLFLMVDHTFIHSEEVKTIKRIIQSGELGRLRYYEASRSNLGLIRFDTNVMWDLAVHDFAILDEILDEQPKGISAHGMDHLGRGHCNTAYITLHYDFMVAHLNLNWLSPVKVRTTVIGGEQKMLHWDDLKERNKITIFDQKVSIGNDEQIHYHVGESWNPQVSSSEETLQTVVSRFIREISDVRPFENDPRRAVRLIKRLEAADESVRRRGDVVEF